IGTIWIVVECGFMRGTVGSNRYGPDPLADSGSNHSVSEGAFTTSPASEPAMTVARPTDAINAVDSATAAVSVAPSVTTTTSVPNDIAENYALILKYSDKARAVAERVSQLPEDLHNRFKVEAVSDPGR